MRSTTLGGPLLSTMLLFAPSALAQGNVIVVDDDGGYDYTTIASAVDAAGDGDTILVRDGSYYPFGINGKSLSVIAEAGSQVSVTANYPSSVLNLGANQQVLIRGIHMQCDVWEPGLKLENNAGVVWIEEVELQPMYAGSPSTATVEVTACAAVHFTRTQVDGIPGKNKSGSFTPPKWGGTALRALNSNLSIWDSRFEGGAGGNGGPGLAGGMIYGSSGGDGLQVDGGTLFASKSTMRGGRGGTPWSLPITPSQSGGDGLVLSNGAQATTLDSTLEGGYGSYPGWGVRTLSGSHTELTGTGRSLEATSPHREGETATLTFSGEPGDLVFLAIGLAQQPITLSGITGPLVVQPIPTLEGVGELDATGSHTFPLSIPAFLPPAVDARHVYFQPVFVDEPATAPQIFLGSGSALSILDATL